MDGPPFFEVWARSRRVNYDALAIGNHESKFEVGDHGSVQSVDGRRTSNSSRPTWTTRCESSLKPSSRVVSLAPSTGRC